MRPDWERVGEGWESVGRGLGDGWERVGRVLRQGGRGSEEGGRGLGEGERRTDALMHSEECSPAKYSPPVICSRSSL